MKWRGAATSRLTKEAGRVVGRQQNRSKGVDPRRSDRPKSASLVTGPRGRSPAGASDAPSEPFFGAPLCAAPVHALTAPLGCSLSSARPTTHSGDLAVWLGECSSPPIKRSRGALQHPKPKHLTSPIPIRTGAAGAGARASSIDREMLGSAAAVAATTIGYGYGHHGYCGYYITGPSSCFQQPLPTPSWRPRPCIQPVSISPSIALRSRVSSLETGRRPRSFGGLAAASSPNDGQDERQRGAFKGTMKLMAIYSTLLGVRSLN